MTTVPSEARFTVYKSTHLCLFFVFLKMKTFNQPAWGKYSIYSIYSIFKIQFCLKRDVKSFFNLFAMCTPGREVPETRILPNDQQGDDSASSPLYRNLWKKWAWFSLNLYGRLTFSRGIASSKSSSLRHDVQFINEDLIRSQIDDEGPRCIGGLGYRVIDS